MECSWFDFQTNDCTNPEYGLTRDEKNELGV